MESNSLNIDGIESVLTLLLPKTNEQGQQIPGPVFEVRLADTSKVNKLIKNSDFLKYFKIQEKMLSLHLV